MACQRSWKWLVWSCLVGFLLVNALEEHEEKDVLIRCRMCGATTARTSEFMALPDLSKSISERSEPLLGDDAKVHTFVNPSRVEMELAGFKAVVSGIESEQYSNKASFFPGYNWRDFRCYNCHRHLGWKFHHQDFQQCINAKLLEALSAASKANANTEGTLERQRELVKKELGQTCVVSTFGWWTYEVCYMKEVRQYHEEADGSRPSDWSMGSFMWDIDTEKEANKPVAQYFANGQHCDENGVLRNTRVNYICCKGDNKNTFAIDTVEEPSLCSYVMTVCVPRLCDQAQATNKHHDREKLESECLQQFSESSVARSPVTNSNSHEDQTPVPAMFYTLRWPNVISDDSSELDWAKKMKFKT